MEYKFAPALISEHFAHAYDFAVNLIGVGKSLQKRVVQINHLRGNESVLDVGAGSGTLVTLLKQKYPGLKITAVDPDCKILEIAKKKAGKKGYTLSFVQACAEKLPFDNNSYDIVYSTLAFHHMPRKIKKLALKEIYRVLKPQGRFVLVDIGKPKNALWKVLLHLESVVEKQAYLQDNLDGNIPIFMREMGFHVTECRKPYIGNRFFIGEKNTRLASTN